MKILAIVDVAPRASMESIRAEIKNEIMGSWELFSTGVLREAYSTATPSRIVLILEADDIGTARAHLRELLPDESSLVPRNSAHRGLVQALHTCLL